MVNRRSVLAGFAAGLLLPLFGLIPAQSNAGEMSEQAADFLRDLSDDGLARLRDGVLNEQEIAAHLRKVVTSSFDMRTIGAVVLGRYWRLATREQRQTYLELFQEQQIRLFSRRFEAYAGEELKILDHSQLSERDSLVSTEIVEPDGDRFRVGWRIRARDGQFRIIDIIVENISLARTQREEFESIIDRAGGRVDALIDQLRVEVGSQS